MLARENELKTPHDAVVLTSLLIGGAIGYYLGANSSSQAPTSPTSPQSSIDSFAQRAPVVQELKVDDTEDEEIAAGTLASAEGLGSIKASLFEECKLVRCIYWARVYCVCRGVAHR